MRLMAENQFDTIYHEHFSYFSFVRGRARVRAARPDALRRRGAADARRLTAHLRPPRRATQRLPVGAARRQRCGSGRSMTGSCRLERYSAFGAAGRATKRALLSFLIDAKRSRQAHRRLRRTRQRQYAAQLLRHPHRLPRVHGRCQPVQAGQVHARHAHPDSARRKRSAQARPDYVLILPWNLQDEIRQQAGYVREWGGHFVVPIPTVQVLD